MTAAANTSSPARWLLLPLVALGSYFTAAAAGIALEVLAERLCPPESMVSGACTAPWYYPVSCCIVCLSAALLAALLVTGCAAAAPVHGAIVAGGTFVAGSATALYVALETGEWLGFAAAEAAGAVALLRILRAVTPRSIGGETRGPADMGATPSKETR